MGLQHNSVYNFLFLLVIVIWYSLAYSFDKNLPDIRCGDTKCWKTGMQTNLFLCTSKEADWNQSFVTCGTVGLQFAILNDDSTLNIDLEQVTHALNQLELTEQAWVSGKAFNGSWFWMDSNTKPSSEFGDMPWYSDSQALENRCSIVINETFFHMPCKTSGLPFVCKTISIPGARSHSTHYLVYIAYISVIFGIIGLTTAAILIALDRQPNDKVARGEEKSDISVTE